jgi:hypothetical protein
MRENGRSIAWAAGQLSSRPLGGILTQKGVIPMDLQKAASYLVSPSKNLPNPPQPQGTFLPLTGNLHDMLLQVFHRSDQECQIPIRFVMAQDGTQTNPARDSILRFIQHPTLPNGLTIANRLSIFSTNKSGLGLLFLLLGGDGKKHKFVLSRFPADQGVVAEAKTDTLEVEFIERVFMKSAASYKAALYKGESFDAHFWSGAAVDKQINASAYQIADYWIRDFLASDFETTSKAGTKRLAVALREASKAAKDIATKHELVAVTMLVPSLANQVLSIRDIMERYHLSDNAKGEILSHLAYPDLADDTFLLDREEFINHAAFASVELNSGGILLAPPDRFEECFQREAIDAQKREYRFTTVGRIVDERVRGRR